MDAYTFGKYAALAKLGFAKILAGALRAGANIPGLVGKAAPKELEALGHYINSVGSKGVRADIWTSHPEIAQQVQNAWKAAQPAATGAANAAGGAARATGQAATSAAGGARATGNAAWGAGPGFNWTPPRPNAPPPGAAPPPRPAPGPAPGPTPRPTPPPPGTAPPPPAAGATPGGVPTPGAAPGAPPAPQAQQPWWKRGAGVAGASVAGGLGVSTAMNAGAKSPDGDFYT